MVELVDTYHNRVRTDILGLAPQDAGRVLDLGGGIGATGAALKANGQATHVVLVDQVADTIATGVDEAYAGDLEDAGFRQRVLAESGPFDTILCLDVLEHLRDPWSTMRDIHGALEPGGCAILSLPNINHVSVVGPLVLRGRFDLVDAGVLDRTHLRWFTRPTAIELATGSGLVLETVQSNISRRLHKLANLLTCGLLNRFFAVQYVIRVRRPV